MDEFIAEYAPEAGDGTGDAEAVPEVQEEPVSRLGDLWTLGDHRVLCGDSTDAAQVERLMDGKKADMVFTDPPYGVDYDSQGMDGAVSGGQWDKIEADETNEVACRVATILDIWPCSQIWWGANCYPSAFHQRGALVVWDKCIVGDRYSPAEVAFVKNEKRVGLFKHQWHGMIKESEHGQARVHPTQKPIALAVWCMNFYEAGQQIVDLFLGSGTTLIAAEQENRICYGMEIAPQYVDVIVKRWQEFTGLVATLEDGTTFGEAAAERLTQAAEGTG